ncbi:hypothetical protein ACET3Z_021963 [Daucus carota]
MQTNIALLALLAFLFIASTSYARPAPEHYLHVMKGEAMLKQQNLTEMRNSGLNKKLTSDAKEKLGEANVHYPEQRLTEEYDDPLFKEKKTVDEFGPEFPIYGGPLFGAEKTVGGKPKP